MVKLVSEWCFVVKLSTSKLLRHVDALTHSPLACPVGYTQTECYHANPEFTLTLTATCTTGTHKHTHESTHIHAYACTGPLAGHCS
jgi:hypothetical protein